MKQVERNHLVRNKVQKVNWRARTAFLILGIGLMFGVPFCHATVLIEGTAGGNKPIGSFVPDTHPEISLMGSRGEVLNFLIKIKTTSCVTLETQKLPQDIRVRYYRMPYVITQHASFPGAYVGSHHDPLIPLSPSEPVCPFLNSKKEATWAWLWGELQIEKSQKPGFYPALIHLKPLSTAEQKTEANLPLSLRVFKMVMPDEPTLKLVTEYSTWYGVLGHFGQSNPQENSLAQKYAQRMREHRMAPIKFWSVIPETPTKVETFKSLYIENRPKSEWVDFPKPTAPATSEQQEAYWKGVQNLIKEYKLADRAVTYLWDEPQKRDYSQIIDLSKQIRHWAPNLKILITSSAPELAPSTDISVPLLNFWPRQNSGTYTWTYLSCMSHGCQGAEESGLPDWVLDRPSPWIRSMGWIAHQLKIKNYLYYNVNYAYQFYPKQDPWKNLWYFTGNGDGTLFYPGRTEGEFHFSEHQPVDSIRIKLWRESSFDAEYLHWIDLSKTKPTGWEKQLNSIVQDQKNWSKNYSRYQELRDLAGKFLDDHFNEKEQQ